MPEQPPQTALGFPQNQPVPRLWLAAYTPPRGGHSASIRLSAGRSLQTAHLRPQLRLGPRNEGRPSDSGNLYLEPPNQEYERCQLVPDHHSTESGQPKIRCVDCRGARRSCRAWVEAERSLNGSRTEHTLPRSGEMRIKRGKCTCCRSCGRLHVLLQQSFRPRRGCALVQSSGGGGGRRCLWSESRVRNPPKGVPQPGRSGRGARGCSGRGGRGLSAGGEMLPRP